MEIKKSLFLAMGCLSIVSMALTSPAKAKTVNAAVESYDLKTQFIASKGSQTDTTAWYTPFGVECINLTEFFVAGQGVSLATNGTLPNYANTPNGEWDHQKLSLHTYTLWSNAGQSADGYYCQYPNGWRMTGEEDPSTAGTAWPDGNYSASSRWMRYNFKDGSIHPGLGLGVVVYFTAPKAGNIYLSDTLSINNYNSDGTYVCAYKIPQADFVTHTWNSAIHHGIFGGTPVYPTAGVSPTSNYTAGWKEIVNWGTTTYTSDTITVAQGDVIAWIYSCGVSTNSDLTVTNPIVTYADSPVRTEVTNFVDTYMHMTDYTENLGWCKDTEHHYYADAKTAFTVLSTDAQHLFKTHSDFTAAFARYQAWATANGDTLQSSSLANLLFNDSNNCTIIVVGIALISVTSIATLVFLKKKKRNY